MIGLTPNSVREHNILGVLQGSILVSLLLLIYKNEMEDNKSTLW